MDGFGWQQQVRCLGDARSSLTVVAAGVQLAAPSTGLAVHLACGIYVSSEGAIKGMRGRRSCSRAATTRVLLDPDLRSRPLGSAIAKHGGCLGEEDARSGDGAAQDPIHGVFAPTNCYAPPNTVQNRPTTVQQPCPNTVRKLHRIHKHRTFSKIKTFVNLFSLKRKQRF